MKEEKREIEAQVGDRQTWWCVGGQQPYTGTYGKKTQPTTALGVVWCTDCQSDNQEKERCYYRLRSAHAVKKLFQVVFTEAKTTCMGC